MAKDSSLPVKVDDVRQWPAMRGDPEEYLARLHEIAGPEGLNEFSLERITTPSGKNTMWMVRDLAEGEKPIKNIEGVLIHQDQRRAFYSEPYEKTGGGQPPDCVSEDMLHGIGDPGIECHSCPYNQFGSGRDDTGKACKEIRRLFILTPLSRLPKVIPAKPGSGTRGTPLYKYLIDSADVGYENVITAFELRTVTAKQRGLEYPQITPRLVRELTLEEKEVVQKLRHSLRSALTHAPVTETDVR